MINKINKYKKIYFYSFGIYFILPLLFLIIKIILGRKEEINVDLSFLLDCIGIFLIVAIFTGLYFITNTSGNNKGKARIKWFCILISLTVFSFGGSAVGIFTTSQNFHLLSIKVENIASYSFFTRLPYIIMFILLVLQIIGLISYHYLKDDKN